MHCCPMCQSEREREADLSPEDRDEGLHERLIVLLAEFCLTLQLLIWASGVLKRQYDQLLANCGFKRQ